VAGEMAQRTSAEWLRLLNQADIPVAPLNAIEDVLADPHLGESGFFVMTEHPTEGRLRMMAAPGTWSRASRGPLRPAPRLGEHGVEILREAGYSDPEIKAMIASGVTRVP
ncbi:MAG: CoA transferase, partial [Burkholderiales bacterium]